MNNNEEQNINLTQDLEENVDLGELHQKISQLQADLLAAETKAANNWDLLLRAKAEEENFRKRSRIDLENAHKYGIEKFARGMLIVVDTLERGIESTATTDPAVIAVDFSPWKSLKEGMELTLKLLLDHLEHFGVKMLNPAVGDAFKPTEHEALSMQENLDLPANSIITVVQKGFVIHDRVLRPAKVIVSKRA